MTKTDLATQLMKALCSSITDNVTQTAVELEFRFGTRNRLVPQAWNRALGRFVGFKGWDGVRISNLVDMK